MRIASLFVVCLIAPVDLLLAGSLQPRLVFVTSASGTGDLGSWPEAGGQVGADAADNICRNLATVAELPSPQDFVAWVSDSSTDAYCRVHGLSGQKTSNCGQTTLPDDAGPWIRVDGTPWAGSISEVLNEGKVYTPIHFDENGHNAIYPYYAFTGTNFSGTLAAPGPCRSSVDWSSNIGSAAVGTQHRTRDNWTYNGDGPCGTPQRLLCLQTGPGAPLPTVSEHGNLAFVTSIGGIGDLGSWAPSGAGIAAADAICQARAQAAGFSTPSSFKAWISDSTSNAADRFAYDGPFVRADGYRVASSIWQLNSLPDVPINLNDQGVYFGNVGAWTGTAWSGYTGNGCDDWTDGSALYFGTIGSVNQTRYNWTSSQSVSCDLSFVLYCLSDHPSVVFEDNFETGDTTAWSNAVPDP